MEADGKEKKGGIKRRRVEDKTEEEDEYAKWSTLVSHAESGDPEAQYRVGKGHEYGNRYVVRNQKTALEWYAKSADKGHVPSLGKYAIHQYTVGNRTAPHLQLLVEASNRGDVHSQFILATGYYTGNDFPNQPEKAITMLQEAARKHHVDAMIQLCIIDPHRWNIHDVIQRISMLPSPRAMMSLALLYRGICPSLSAVKNIADSISWFEKSACAGNDESCWYLYKLFLDSNNPQRNPVKAAEWLMKGVSRGNLSCQYALGMAHLRGELGFAKDKVAAFRWLLCSAAQDYLPALYMTARLYEEGVGTPINMAAAFDFYQRAIVTGDAAPAMYYLSFMYRDGRGCGRNNNLYLYWCRRAALRADTDAIDHLVERFKGGDRKVLHDMKEIQESVHLVQ